MFPMKTITVSEKKAISMGRILWIQTQGLGFNVLISAVIGLAI